MEQGERRMTKEQEFRKRTEEAKFEAFSFMCKKVTELEAKIEKMKADVMANIKWADKNCDNMWQKLVKMWNQWEIKEK